MLFDGGFQQEAENVHTEEKEFQTAHPYACKSGRSHRVAQSKLLSPLPWGLPMHRQSASSAAYTGLP